MTNDYHATWSKKKPDTPDDIHKNVEHWEKHLSEEERNPNAKETFDRTTERTAQPSKSEPGKPAQSDSYTGK